MEPQKQKNSNALTIALLLLIISIGVNIYQWKNHATTILQYNTEVDSLSTAKLDVDRELASISMELEKYRGIAGNLDTLLNDANNIIMAQEQKIRKIIQEEKNKDALTKRLKTEMEQLRKLRDEYLDKIDNLMAENKVLKNENASLNSTVSDLNEQKNLLESKVTTASQLKIEYLKVNSFKKRNSGKYVESVLAKRTNKIESCFTLMDNKVAPAGDKMLYLVILAPDGKTLMGYSKTQFVMADGKDLDATSSLKVSYTGEKQNLCLSFENEERILIPGTYSINIYVENTLVHQSNYLLK